MGKYTYPVDPELLERLDTVQGIIEDFLDNLIPDNGLYLGCDTTGVAKRILDALEP